MWAVVQTNCGTNDRRADRHPMRNKVAAALAVACVSALPSRPLAQPAPERTAVVDGVRLQYVDWGGQGPALVLVPGGCDTAFVFGDLAPRLTGTFHVLS